MNKDQAISKIKKCLALSRSADTHEAAAAMRQAQKLMDLFEVREHDVSMADVTEESIKARNVGPAAWGVRLARICAEAFGCEIYASLREALTDAGNLVKHRFYVFVGIDAAPKVAGYAYQVLARQCAVARQAHIAKQSNSCKPITKSARGDAFATGWVIAVRELVQRFAQPESDKQLLLSYMDKRHPDMARETPRDATRGRMPDPGHFMRGHQAGQTADLKRGVGAMPERELLS